MPVGQLTSLRNQTIGYPFDKINSPNLVKFLFLVHERIGLKPEFDFKVYLKGMKKLLEKYGEEKTISLILRAGEVSSFPFSTKFLEELGTKENKESDRSTHTAL